jgi:hypothetical protein
MSTRVTICLVLVLCLAAGRLEAQTPARLHALAHVYYAWRDSTNPVGTSDAGGHQWDDRLADYRISAVQARRLHTRTLLDRVKAMHRELEQGRPGGLAAVPSPARAR